MSRNFKTQVAQYWNTIAPEFDSIYSGEGKSPLGRWMDRVFRADMYGRYEWVMRAAGDVRGKTVCDIGCGSGRFVTQFAQRGARHVTGIDVAPEMLKIARQLVRQDGVADRCEFVLADFEQWQTDRIFDLVIAIGFWDYIVDPAAYLRHIRPLTNGRFLSAWPRLWTWRMPVRKIRLQCLGGCPVFFYRKPQVYRLLEDAGFKVLSCEAVGKLFCVESDIRA